MLTYIISGASSFIGLELTRQLICLGNRVIALCRKTSRNLPLLLDIDGVEIVYSDLEHIDYLLGKDLVADVFVHLAWIGTGRESRNDKTIQNRNIMYSENAFEVACQAHCKLFVEAGSQAEYGIVQGVMTEDTPCFPLSEYGCAKLKFGEIASGKCKSVNMKFIHLRILSVFGKADHPWTLIMTSIKKMLNNEDVELSSCEQLWNFVDVRDAVKQIYLLCEHALNTPDFSSEIYLIGSNDTRKLRSFVNEIYLLTKSKSKLIWGSITSDHIVSLNPCMDKTELATGGFISSVTFGQVIIDIIRNYKDKLYD